MAMTVQSTFSSTGPAIGYTGTLDSNLAHDVVTMINAESSSSIGFGLAVKFKDTVTTDQDAVLPAAQADKVLGVMLRADTYGVAWTDLSSNTFGQLDSNGVKPGGFLNILKRGRVLVTCQSGCEAGDKLYVRAISGTSTVIGGLENAADAAKMIDCTASGTWMTSATAGSLAWLDINFA